MKQIVDVFAFGGAVALLVIVAAARTPGLEEMKSIVDLAEPSKISFLSVLRTLLLFCASVIGFRWAVNRAKGPTPRGKAVE